MAYGYTFNSKLRERLKRLWLNYGDTMKSKGKDSEGCGLRQHLEEQIKGRIQKAVAYGNTLKGKLREGFRRLWLTATP